MLRVKTEYDEDDNTCGVFKFGGELLSARFVGFLSGLGLSFLGASASGSGDGGVDLSLQGLNSLLEKLDGAGLVGGEGGFGEGVVVDEDGFGEKKLLERFEIG